MLSFATLRCPWCGESFETAVDPCEGDADYVEDCQVCCAPIRIQVQDTGGRPGIVVERA